MVDREEHKDLTGFARSKKAVHGVRACDGSKRTDGGPSKDKETDAE